MDSRPSENLPQPQPNKEKTKEQATRLNNLFKSGAHVANTLEQVQAFPRPIAIDFNNVLVNGFEPYQVNPEAAIALKQLREIGNVFVVTTKSGWEKIHKVLEEGGLWSDDMVLLAYENWQDKTTLDWRDLSEKYVDMMKEKGHEYTTLSFSGEKRIAPIFGREEAVPLIDDGLGAIRNNPGVLGLQIHGFEPGMSMEGEFTLQQAVDKVRDYYSSSTSS